MVSGDKFAIPKKNIRESDDFRIYFCEVLLTLVNNTARKQVILTSFAGAYKSINRF